MPWLKPTAKPCRPFGTWRSTRRWTLIERTQAFTPSFTQSSRSIPRLRAAFAGCDPAHGSGPQVAVAPASVAPVRGLGVLAVQLSHGLLRCAVGYIPSPPFGGWADPERACGAGLSPARKNGSISRTRRRRTRLAKTAHGGGARSGGQHENSAVGQLRNRSSTQQVSAGGRMAEAPGARARMRIPQLANCGLSNR